LNSDDKDCEHSSLLLPQIVVQTASTIKYLIMPLIRKAVEKMNARKSKAVWIIVDLMKQKAVMGRNMVRLYP
jgi:hypothetical protein